MTIALLCKLLTGNMKRTQNLRMVTLPNRYRNRVLEYKRRLSWRGDLELELTSGPLTSHPSLFLRQLTFRLAMHNYSHLSVNCQIHLSVKSCLYVRCRAFHTVFMYLSWLSHLVSSCTRAGIFTAWLRITGEELQLRATLQK